jgi:phosphomannomutase
VSSNFNELKATDNMVLFDMDGTLTEARKQITNDVVQALRDLSDHAYIGLVSGSPMNYIQEQMAPAWNQLSTVPVERILIMPCNGTQAYVFKRRSSNFELTYKANLTNHLETICAAPDPYRELITNLVELQAYSMRKYDHPVSGNFISYRESLLNWCMIGRDASHEDRAAFTFEDSEKDLRQHLRECLRVRLDASGLHEVDLALGGSTSIDIYPKGWDKTHALRHLGESTVWFAGDKCTPSGNDYALYAALESTGRVKHVRTPQDTIGWIRGEVIPAIKGDS